MMWIDHVVLGVRDLDTGAERLFTDLGLASLDGGRHAGRGTANRIVPLGHDYIEVLAVVDAAEAATDEFGRFAGHQVAGGDRLVGWCLATDDLDHVAAERGLDAEQWSRDLPDGSTLSWRLAGLEVALREPYLPFFIAWDGPPERHPGRAAVAHRVSPRGIAWVEVAGDRSRLDRWLGEADIPVKVGEGRLGPLATGIATDAGEIVLR